MRLGLSLGLGLGLGFGVWWSRDIRSLGQSRDVGWGSQEMNADHEDRRYDLSMYDYVVY